MTSWSDLAQSFSDAGDHANRAARQLGWRPVDPVAAAAWDLNYKRVRNQADRLYDIAVSLNAQEIIDAAAALAPQLDQIGEATAAANAVIDRIAEIGRAMRLLSKVIELGTAIVGFAAAPGAGLGGLFDAVRAVRDEAAA